MRGAYIHSPLRNLIVRNDWAGKGAYGARRTRTVDNMTVVYTHKGVDLACAELDAVYSPVDAVVARIGNAYQQAERSAFKLIELEWTLGTMKLMYVHPLVPVGCNVSAGDQIAEMVDVSQLYPNTKMQCHLHWEVQVRAQRPDRLDLVDPLMFFGRDEVRLGNHL